MKNIDFKAGLAALVGLALILIFALGLILGAKVERGVADLKARQAAIARVIE